MDFCLHLCTVAGAEADERTDHISGVWWSRQAAAYHGATLISLPRVRWRHANRNTGTFHIVFIEKYFYFLLMVILSPKITSKSLFSFSSCFYKIEPESDNSWRKRGVPVFISPSFFHPFPDNIGLLPCFLFNHHHHPYSWNYYCFCFSLFIS